MDTANVANLIAYDVNEAAIQRAREAYLGLSADTPQGYEEVRLALADLRGHRVGIEKRRVALKADALDYGRRVDAEAKRLTALIIEIEEPLSQKKHDVDYEKARVRAEAETARQEALAAKIRAEREVEEAKLRAARNAEEVRLAAERKVLEAERAALAEERRQAEAKAVEARAVLEAAARVEEAKREAERAKIAEERRAEEERQRAEREAIEQERRTVAAEREQAERAEFERQAKIKAEAEAVAKAERDRIAAAEHAAKLAALAPDIEKVRLFAAAIRALPVPKGRTKDAKTAISDAVTDLGQIAATLESFGAA